MNRFIKIRNISTGLYSSGGSYPTWVEDGKRWNKKNHATSHITNATKGIFYKERKHFYDNAELVEFEYEPTEISSMPLRQIIEDKKQAEQKREERYKQSAEAERYRKAQEVIAEFESKHHLH
jgi:hypothetical protein